MDGVLEVASVTEPGPGAPFANWVVLSGGLEPGTGVALATEGSEVLLAGVLAGGGDVRVWRSADEGESWSVSHTASGAGEVTSVAIALRPDGDACLFLGTGAAVKRLRRTGGSWAPSPVPWTHALAGVSGVAATHRSGNYELLVAGTAADGNGGVWACALGDGGLPPNVWSALVPVAWARAENGTAFLSPLLAVTGAELQARWVEERPATPAERRTFGARVVGGAPVTAHRWEEPWPCHPEGVRWAAMATRGNSAWLATSSSVWWARPVPALEVSLCVRRVAWRERVDGRFALTVELTDPEGRVVPGVPPAAAGCSVRVRLGYHSGPGGEPEYGRVLEGVVERIWDVSRDGVRRVGIEAAGALEWGSRRILSRPWVVPAGSVTRSELGERLLARLGVPASLDPPLAWQTETLGQLAMPGERGERLIATLVATGDRVLRGGAGLLEIAPFGSVAVAEYGGEAHVLLGMERHDELPEANWVRVATGTGVAEAVVLGSVATHGPHFGLDRRLTGGDVSLDGLAAATLAAFRRRQRTQRLRIPADVGLEVGDLIVVAGAPGRVLGIEGVYSRGVPSPAFEMTLEVGEE